MEITLEKIELVKDRTGASYKEAKDALEACDGSVVDAIIKIEEAVNDQETSNLGDYGKLVLEKIKELVKKGNVSKIVIKKDGEVILNVPISVGVLGTIISPIAMIVGVAATFGFKCTIEVVKDDGTIFDVSEYATEQFDSVKEKGTQAFSGIADKGQDVVEKAKDKVNDIYINRGGEGSIDDVIDSFKDKAQIKVDQAKDFVSTAKDRVSEFKDSTGDILEKTQGFAHDVTGKACEYATKAKEVALDKGDMLKGKAEEAFGKAEEAVGKAKEVASKALDKKLDTLDDDINLDIDVDDVAEDLEEEIRDDIN